MNNPFATHIIHDSRCIDCKIKPHEKTKRLTFRPVYRTIPPIRYRVVPDGKKWVHLEVFPRMFGVYDNALG